MRVGGSGEEEEGERKGGGSKEEEKGEREGGEGAGGREKRGGENGMKGEREMIGDDRRVRGGIEKRRETNGEMKKM